MCGIDLLNFAHEIINVIDPRRIWVSLVCETIERIVHILNRLALAICLAGQIADCIVRIGLAVGRRECRLGDSAERIVGKVGCKPIRIRNAHQVILCVVGILRPFAPLR